MQKYATANVLGLHGISHCNPPIFAKNCAKILHDIFLQKYFSVNECAAF